MEIDVCFVHFRTLNLKHLDAAWYSLYKQDFTNVRRVVFLDNNTDASVADIQTVLHRYPLPVPVITEFNKHGLSDRTQSWSVNRVCSWAESEWILFTRADYILAFDALYRFRQLAISHGEQDQFISGWCFQMAYDREAKNVSDDVNIETYGWREGGMPALMQHPYAFRFHETDQDAGVWFTKKAMLARAGWMNEQLVSWGYQQSEFQRMIKRTSRAQFHVIQDYLFAHQHHYSPRDFKIASAEYHKAGRG